MRKFGLIGYPLGHSFSRKYFSEKFLNENISDCSYENFPLQDISQLNDLLAKETDLAGFNVTIPYKSAVLKYLQSVSPEAAEIGAVNVVKVKREDGIKLSGFNSDITGIEDSLKGHLGSHIKAAFVLGTGGSSRAVCYVLKKMGIEVTLVSRTKKPGVMTYDEIQDEKLLNTFLIVNTTPSGMFPDVDSKPDINYKVLGSRHVLFDLVYNPEHTSFLKMGKDQGCAVISGIKMLHSQAEKAWEIWNDNSL